MIAGNATIWKPSPSTPLCSIAVTKIVADVLKRNGVPGAVGSLVTGGKDVGEALVESRGVELGLILSFVFSNVSDLKSIFSVSFTGSEAVGRNVGKVVQSRFGKVLLELGGNNGMYTYLIVSASLSISYRIASVVMADADLSLAVPAVFFGAIGTAGQRCTSTRRLYLQRQIASEFLSRLQQLYSTVRVGDPLMESTLLGPLHNRAAVDTYSNAVRYLRQTGAEILEGGKRYEEGHLLAGNFVQPTIAIPKSMNPADPIWKTETFAPILNAAVFDELEQAIEWNNSVPQGLSSSLWTRDLRNVGRWIGPRGSDTGIVNVRGID
jgi:aldehyde dehydrogenase family 7 protein A1